MTVTDRLNNFSPILVRLLARQNCQPMSTDCIAAFSGLDQPSVEFISHQTSWKEIRLQDALQFLMGCRLGIDDTQAWRRAMDYLSKRPTFRYLRASDDWSDYYEPMLRKWLETSCEKEDLREPVRTLVKRLTPAVNRGVGAKFQKV